MQCQLQLTMLTLDMMDVEGDVHVQVCWSLPTPATTPMQVRPLGACTEACRCSISPMSPFHLGLRTCLTFTSLASAHILNIYLTQSTLQSHAKRAFILPLMTCHSFHLAQSLMPHLMHILAQHGPTPILCTTGTALAMGTLSYL